jgi:hypothetical protein
MSDVFISYKHEDEARVEMFQAALKAAGLNVWWDKHIPGGYRWRQRIQSELESAKCVLVVWSEHSTGPTADIVIDEANRGRRRGVLLQVRIDDVGLPLGFGEHQALELIGWNGNSADPRFQDVVAALKAIVAGTAIPVPQALPRSKRGIWPAATVVAFALTSALLVSFAGESKAICGIPGVHGLCGRFGMGGVPSPDDEALWTRRKSGDCEALRLYLQRFPLGAYSAEANSRLHAPNSRIEVTWTTEERHGIPATTCTSPRPAVPGSIRSSDGSPRLPTSGFGEARSRACKVWKRPFGNIWTPTTNIPDLSSGLPTPI